MSLSLLGATGWARTLSDESERAEAYCALPSRIATRRGAQVALQQLPYPPLEWQEFYHRMKC